MDDEGERTPERRTGYIQFHWNVRRYRHGLSCASPIRPCGSLQALLSRQHVPAFGTRVRMDPRIVARPHDSVRQHRSVAPGCGKLQWSDDRDRFTSPRGSVSWTEFGEPHSAVFLHDNPGRTLRRVRGLPAWKRAQMPVDRCLIEMKAGDRADVEAAKLRPLLARRHVHTGHFSQVPMSGGGGDLGLSPQGSDRRDLTGDHGQSEHPDE